MLTDFDIVESTSAICEHNSGSMTVQNFDIDGLINRFLEFADVSAQSEKTYRRGLKAFFEYWESQARPVLTREFVISYRDFLESEGRKATTIHTYLAPVRIFATWAHAEGLIAVDIASRVKAPKITRAHKKDALTSNQLSTVLKNIDRTTVKGRRDYAMVLLCGVCGLRTVEVMRANVSDMRSLGDRTVLYVQGKGRTEKAEFVRLPEAVENAIRLTFKDRTDTNDQAAPLFVSTSHNNQGKRMTTRAISAICKESFLEVGLTSDRLTAHSLRHTAVTLALLGGESLQTVQAFARHAAIATTTIYAHNLDSMKNTSENTIINSLSL